MVNNLTVGGTFAIHSECVDSKPGYKRGRHGVEGKAGKLISFRPPEEFYRPYGDYRVHRH